MPGPAVLLIPLMSGEATALIGAGAAAVGAYLAGNAIKNSYNNSSPNTGSMLQTNSNQQEFSTATANYLKAEQEREALRAKGLSGIPLQEATKEISNKYDYVETDDKGNLAVKADDNLVQGGPLQLQEQNGTVTVANDSVNIEIPYTNYGTNNDPWASNSAVNSQLSEDAATAYVRNDGVITEDPQFVAQQAIMNQNMNDGLLQDYNAGDDYARGIGQDVVIPEANPDVTNVQTYDDYLGTTPTSQDYVDPTLDAEMAREAARGGQRGYLEDSGNPADTNAISSAGSMEQARALERADAAALSAADPGGTPLPGSTTTPGFRQSEASSDPNYNSQATPKMNTSGMVSRNLDYPKEKPNPLHDYVNYTYNIAMYAVPRAVINQITTGQIGPGGEDAIIAQAELILRSGGSKTADKGKYFGQDFYIDNLMLKSIVGQSARNRSTDVIEINFDVVEPYNCTFLPRLIATAYAQNGVPDWGSNFYLLKISFLGYTEEGMPINIPNTTKYVPISLVNMEYEIDERGSTYKIKAIPCHHMAQTLLDNTVPFHMEIVGGTVDEIFNSSASTATSGTAAVQADPNANQAGSRGDRLPGGGTGTTTAGNTASAAGPQTFTKGVAQALNDLEKYYVDQGKQTIPNKYSFRFEDGIGSKKVIDAQHWQEQGFRMSNPKDPNEQVGKSIKLDKTKTKFQVNAGTRLTDLISSVLQVSEYMSGQYQTPSPKDKPLYSFKIIPEVKFGEFDSKTNVWSREVTYVVIPYVIFGQDVEGFGQQAPPGATKRFKYLFTGQNKDVLNVKIDFKAAFYTLRQAATDAILSEGDVPTDYRQPAEDLKMGILPQRVKNVMGIADMNNSGPKTQNEKTISVQQLFKKQFDSVADNIRLDITIVGDPDLIQQDNIMYGSKGDRGKMIYDVGGVNFTSYEAYFNFQMVYPSSDYSDDTGLFQVTNKSSEQFNGLYKIIQVTSEFRNGTFTQKLENYRVKNQSNQSQTTGSASSDAGARSTSASGSQSNSIASQIQAQVQSSATGQGINAISNLASQYLPLAEKATMRMFSPQSTGNANTGGTSKTNTADDINLGKAQALDRAEQAAQPGTVTETGLSGEEIRARNAAQQQSTETQTEIPATDTQVAEYIPTEGAPP